MHGCSRTLYGVHIGQYFRLLTHGDEPDFGTFGELDEVSTMEGICTSDLFVLWNHWLQASLQLRFLFFSSETKFLEFKTFLRCRDVLLGDIRFSPLFGCILNGFRVRRIRARHFNLILVGLNRGNDLG